MTKQTLLELYKAHAGKASDKWSLYLDIYESLFSTIRDKRVSLLEIGVQNGGSLELWSRYFEAGSSFIGCDIDPRCATLHFDDPRIGVVIGDAGSDATSQLIFARQDSFDVIIDDGSHHSGDIVRAFARYFPHLNDGGLYIVEDLHCSYWPSFGGGLFSPSSSLAFFRTLTDVMNAEFFREGYPSTRLVEDATKQYQVEIDDELLASVRSVSFFNSICVITKGKPDQNRLGERFIVGQEFDIEKLTPLKFGPEMLGAGVGQSWPEQVAALTGIRDDLQRDVDERDKQIARLSAAVADRESQLTQREDQLAEHQRQLAERESEMADVKSGAERELAEQGARIVELSLTLGDRDARIRRLAQQAVEADRKLHGVQQSSARMGEVLALRERQISDLIVSRSWRLTRPLRFFGRQLRRLKHAFVQVKILYSNRSELTSIPFRAARVFKREGFRGVEQRLVDLRSGQFPPDGGQVAKPAPEIVNALSFVGDRILNVSGWWMAGRLRRETSIRTFEFLRGETRHARTLAHRFKIHVDKPTTLINLTDSQFAVEGWAVDLLTSSALPVRVRIGRSVHPSKTVLRPDVQHVFRSICKLPFDTGFSSAPTLKIGIHLLRIEVQTDAQTWTPIRRHLLFHIPYRLRNDKQTYGGMTRLEQKRLKAELPDIRRHISLMPQRPTFTIVVDARREIAGMDATLRSIRDQYYAGVHVLVLRQPHAEPVFSLLKNEKFVAEFSSVDIEGDFIILLEVGQRLAVNATYEFAAAINQYPDADVFYGDEDSVSASGERHNPFYKPSWSPDYLESFNYIGFASCFRRTTLEEGAGDIHLFDLVLRCTEQTARIRHIPRILGHRNDISDVVERPAADVARDVTALQARLARTGRRGTVAEHPLHPGCYEIRLELNHRPLVSVVIPTAAKTIAIGDRRIDLITNLVGQIRSFSTYKNVEIIVVDNGDLSPEQKATLARAYCKFITYRESAFNIARKLNLGVSIASGEMLALMNDDIEILAPSWLERMIEHFEKPHVGVVGARLRYPDGTLQHVGVVHNYGNPDHVRRSFPPEDAGYFFSTCGVRNYAAVTGACMMTPTALYREVGGYTEELAVSFNDVDYCLKVRQKGLSIVYAPQAELTHMESQSRVASADWNEVAFYQKRWAGQVVPDPFYNERFLTVAPPTFIPAINQRML